MQQCLFVILLAVPCISRTTEADQTLPEEDISVGLLQLGSKVNPLAHDVRHASPGAADQPEGVLHFLFMVEDKLLHKELWADFFASAPPQSYTLWLHCAKVTGCSDPQSLGLPGLRLVDRVASHWCTDLVSPGVKMMEEALKCGLNATREKFITVSESTLPIKPFSAVQRELLKDDKSYFCPFGTDDWGKFRVEGAEGFLVKHSQWWVLNRRHAERLVENFVPSQNFAAPLPSGENLLMEYEQRPHGPSCLDEFAPFATLFGPYREGQELLEDYDFQCHTLSLWSNNAVEEILAEDKINLIRDDGFGAHPVTLIKIDNRSLNILRAQKALFTRKFQLHRSAIKDFRLLLREKRSIQTQRLAGSGLAQCSQGPEQRSPLVLHFLFLLQSELLAAHERIWRDFFAKGDSRSYRSWALCTTGPNCDSSRSSVMTWVDHPSPMISDKSVYRMHCFVHLLKAALAVDVKSKHEKFVFMDETTLPLRPFPYIYTELSKGLSEVGSEHRITSDMCIKPYRDWHRISDACNADVFLPRHSKFMVLSKNDARQLAKVWRITPGKPPSFLFSSGTFAKTNQLSFKAFSALLFGPTAGTELRVPLAETDGELLEYAPYVLAWGIFPPSPVGWGGPAPLSSSYNWERTTDHTVVERQRRCRTLRWDELSTLNVTLQKELEAAHLVKNTHHWHWDVAHRLLKEQGFLFAGPFDAHSDLTGYSEVMLL